MEIISFNELEEVKGERRSNFNEELLNSSCSNNTRPADLVPSSEFILKSPKTSKRQREIPKIEKEIEISIDIDWPAQKI